ncbi:MAG: Pr6Pr family membrane protein [Pyrinomonadaceae bacterium]
MQFPLVFHMLASVPQMQRYWLFFVPKGELSWRHPFYWLVYPALYLPWVLIYGELTGRYPYPFVHVGNLGYPTVLLNSLGLFILCLIVAWVFVGIDKLMGRRVRT